MTPTEMHLTEDERHAFADGTLSPEQSSSAEMHLAACQSCRDDVARITTFMKRVLETPPPQTQLDELWPSIRTRIEQSKVVPLAGSGAREAGGGKREAKSGRRAGWLAAIGVVAAAAIIAIVLPDRTPVAGDATVATARDTATTLVAVVDSTHAFEEEARILLNRLELQRAMLRPEAAQALDRDLRVVDVAIAELKDAVARDPNNPALRRLLASSYRQKVDLLKRVANAS
jgi:anti-sigma factor RsiW